jgi:hypothetical protein
MTGTAVEANWLTLYREAVFEQDPEQLRVRVAHAQHAIRSRARELWYGGAKDGAERRRMDAASHFLGILRTIGTNKGAL